MSQENNIFIGILGSNGGGSGVQGAQGVSGAQGAQGSSGIQGFQGFQGVSGAQGTQGTQGVLGIQGLQGRQGVDGFQGTQGLQGVSGSQGTQGIAGGGVGSQGTQGITPANMLYPFKLASGSTITNSVLGNNPITAVSNDISNFALTPIVFNNGFVCDAITFATLTSLASTNAKLLIYSHNYSTALPSDLIYSSTSINVSASNTDFVVSLSITFQAGIIYWIGLIRDTTTIGNQLFRGFSNGTIMWGYEPNTNNLVNAVYAQSVNFTSPPNPIDPLTLLYSGTAVLRCYAFNFRISSNL